MTLCQTPLVEGVRALVVLPGCPGGGTAEDDDGGAGGCADESRCYSGITAGTAAAHTGQWFVGSVAAVFGRESGLGALAHSPTADGSLSCLVSSVVVAGRGRAP